MKIRKKKHPRAGIGRPSRLYRFLCHLSDLFFFSLILFLVFWNPSENTVKAFENPVGISCMLGLVLVCLITVIWILTKETGRIAGIKIQRSASSLPLAETLFICVAQGMMIASSLGIVYALYRFIPQF